MKKLFLFGILALCIVGIGTALEYYQSDEGEIIILEVAVSNELATLIEQYSIVEDVRVIGGETYVVLSGGITHPQRKQVITLARKIETLILGNQAGRITYNGRANFDDCMTASNGVNGTYQVVHQGGSTYTMVWSPDPVCNVLR